MIIFTEEFKIYVLPWISLSVTLYIAYYVYTNILCAIHVSNLCINRVTNFIVYSSNVPSAGQNQGETNHSQKAERKGTCLSKIGKSVQIGRKK